MARNGRVRSRHILTSFFCICTCVVLAACTDHGVPIEIKHWDHGHGRPPLFSMIDVTNAFGIKVLAEHNYLNDNNIAFSPYGLMGIMVALYEGVNGESSYQIQRAMQLPWNRNIMRIGFRDIHRTLKTYFVPEEGFLAGLALNDENVTFNENYKTMLQFYGFDLEKSQIPTVHPTLNNTSTTQPITSTSNNISGGNTLTSAMTPSSIPNKNHTTYPITVTTDKQSTTMTPLNSPTTSDSEGTSVSNNMETTISKNNITGVVSNANTILTTTLAMTPQGTTEKVNTVPISSSTQTSLSDSSGTEETTPNNEALILTTSGLISTVTDSSFIGTFIETTTQYITTSHKNPGSITSEGNNQGTSETIFENTTLVTQSTATTTENTTNVASTTESSIFNTDEFISSTATSTFSTTNGTSTSNGGLSTNGLTSTDRVILTTSSGTPVEENGTSTTEGSTLISNMSSITTDNSISPMNNSLSSIHGVMSTNSVSNASNSPFTAGGTTLTSENSSTTNTVTTTSETLAGDNDMTTMNIVSSTTDSGAFITDSSNTVDGGNTTAHDGMSTNGFSTTNSNWAFADKNSTLTSTTESDTFTTVEASTADFSSPTVSENNNGVSDLSTTNNSNLETFERRKKSLVDFIFTTPITPYAEDFLLYRSFEDDPELPKSFDYGDQIFLGSGIKDNQVTYMQYDTVLDHAFLPHLDASALRLPLDSDKYYLLVVLPRRQRAGEIGRLLARMALTSDLSDIYGALRPRRVRAMVPSFKVKGHVILTTDLQRLGIREVFHPRQSNFAPMTPQTGVYVRSIEQEVSVVIRKYQADDNKKNRYVPNRHRVYFTATYPFLYFVMDSNIHVALMAGKMVDPLNTRVL